MERLVRRHSGACGPFARPTSPQWHKFLGDARHQSEIYRREYDAPGAFAAVEVWPNRTRVQFIDGGARLRHDVTIPTGIKLDPGDCRNDLDSAFGADPTVDPGPPPRCNHVLAPEAPLS